MSDFVRERSFRPPRDRLPREGFPDRPGGSEYFDDEGYNDPYQDRYPGRGAPPSDPPGYDRRLMEYERRPFYDSTGYGPGASRGDFRAPPPPPPIRAEAEYSRTREYPPSQPRRGDYSDPAYYPPPSDRPYRRPDPYVDERIGVPPPLAASYREPERDPRDPYSARRRDEEFDRRHPYSTYPLDPQFYEPESMPSARRNPGTGYERPAVYDTEASRTRRVPAPPLPPANNREPYYEFSLPAEGIRKEVLQREITLFLGNDATMRGPITTPDV